MRRVVPVTHPAGGITQVPGVVNGRDQEGGPPGRRQSGNQRIGQVLLAGAIRTQERYTQRGGINTDRLKVIDKKALPPLWIFRSKL